MNSNRTALFYLLLVLVGIGAIVRIVRYQFIVPPDTSALPSTTRVKELPAKRGSIMATDGRYLAFSLIEYKIGLDCTVASDSLMRVTVKPLSSRLAAYFKEKPASYYDSLIRDGFKRKKKFIALSQKTLSRREMEYVCQFPMLEKGPAVGGVVVDEYPERQYPYKSLAYRTLGQIKEDKSKMVGIEASCDSILEGKNGILHERRTERKKWVTDQDSVNREPVNGVDIRTTIDIDIQQIAERAMRNQLKKSNDIQYGTVIVMETVTGYIRAMVNLDKGKDGEYHESINHAISGIGEPGSVFKLATLTLLLEEGKTTLDHVISPAPKVIKCGKAKEMKDNYLRDYSSISVMRGFEISSNNVFRKLAWDNYHNDPRHFVEALDKKIKISWDYDFDIEGLRKAHIKHPDDRDKNGKKTWSDSDLPQIAMGYTSNITPLHTVNFYNAIANGGIMMQPRLIESHEKDGVVIRRFEPEVIGRVCSEKTAKELHRAMRRVVTENHATAETAFKGCRVAVAGKTGTAQIGYSNKGRKKKQHQATFAGFFPYENPKYTVIAVLYSNPSDKDYYGSSWGGPVVREIAEEIYASNPEWGAQCTERASMPEPDDGRSLRDSLFSAGLENGTENSITQ